MTIHDVRKGTIVISFFFFLFQEPIDYLCAVHPIGSSCGRRAAYFRTDSLCVLITRPYNQEPPSGFLIGLDISQNNR